MNDLPAYFQGIADRDGLAQSWHAFLESYPIVVMSSTTGVPVPVDMDLRGEEGLQKQFDAMYFQTILPALRLPGLSEPVDADGALPSSVQLVSARICGWPYGYRAQNSGGSWCATRRKEFGVIHPQIGGHGVR